jgi:hypothetical protein
VTDTIDIAVINACGGTLRARLRSPAADSYDAIRPVGTAADTLWIEFSIHGNTRTLSTVKDLVNACSEGCSLLDSAIRDPEGLARIIHFLLFTESPRGHVSGPSPRTDDILLGDFGIDPWQNIPRVVGNELRYIALITEPAEGPLKPILRHERRVMAVTVDLTTAEAKITRMNPIGA